MSAADSSPPAPALVIGRGARATEALLLAELCAFSDAARAEPRLLALPVRVVVPSRSLREHVAAAIVRDAGRSVAGIVVQTLHGVALEILAAAGEPAPRGDALFPILVRRAARDEPALRDALEPLEDAWGVVAAAVADLLDAGFEAAHAEAVDEWLEAAALAPRSRARVRAVARVAARVPAELARHGLGRRGARLARAADLLAGDPQGLLPARAVLVHGFADATGVASDLLEALLRLHAAQVFVDQPPDPADPTRKDVGWTFTDRLLRRLAGHAAVREVESAPAAPEIRGLRAAGAFAEARAVAERVRGLLDAGVRAEGIGVVARDLAAFALPIRLHFGRLGIPFSGFGAEGPPDGAGRRVHALLDLVLRGAATPAERWLDARRDLGRIRRFDLRLGLHHVGAARLRDVAALDLAAVLDGRGYLPLPARRGLSEGDDADDAPFARRRTLAGEALADAVRSATGCAARLAAWPAHAPLAAHLAELRALASVELGWSPRAPEARLLADALSGLEAELPAALALEKPELDLLLRRVLRAAGCPPLGGDGAGVQVLGAVEARARSFERLFLIGVNRDAFPRPVLEDPLLPDPLRARLAELLPEMPVKARGFDEEHYLFAQLLSAGPDVTLSFQVADDEGKARSPSPLVTRLELALGEFAQDAPSLVARPDPARPLARTAQEAALAEGLHGTRAGFEALLPLALAEAAASDDAPGAPDPAGLARGRAAVLNELDPDLERSRALGPYFGFVGPMRLPQDLRRAPLYVTQLERLVRCPWQMFLSRLLGLEPAPDALLALPELSPLLLGGVVHRVLEEIVRDALGDTPEILAEAAAGAARSVPWPLPDELARRTAAAAAAVVRAEGVPSPGLAALLAEAARPLVDAARELDWPLPASDVACLGAELTGAVSVPAVDGSSREIRFRADRVDRVGGALRVVDYKTGRPLDKSLTGQLSAGMLLQAAAYAFGCDGEGRYLYLKRGADPEAVVPVAAADAQARAAFERVVGTVLAAFDAGSFFPRLAKVDARGAPRACNEWCEVRDACLQGDASARARLYDWTRQDAARDEAERALLALWQLPGKEVT